ncbi:MAG TPA: Mrp/NBP35 family ATP-binding protein [Candidatus Poseidoniaceae archaeon]|jgi:Mrp family chromosome partitioning ATPase|nr:Mrp/NBP35 family ATP-binding protein [Candidatus Poseidoniaceae archaeon]
MSNPLSIHNPSDSGEDSKSNSPTAEQQKQMEAAYSQMKRKMAMEKLSSSIKHKIMVMSGKGGVGKSTVSTGLALALAKEGNKVGIMDIDITGPNVPKMLGLENHRLHVDEGRIHPAEGPEGVKVISMAFLLEAEDTPVVWRGPIKLGAIQQFIGDVEWGSLDYLIIDFPPGTSDEPLTVAQSLQNIDGIVIVTTPQEIALLDSRKSINFAKSLKMNVLGIVENMSGYTVKGSASDFEGNVMKNMVLKVNGPGGKVHEVITDEDGKWNVSLDIFKMGGGKKASEDYSVPFLGKIPFDPGIVRSGDDGVHRIVAEPEGISAIAFDEVIKNLKEILESGNSDSELEII